jgi:hypothetical protein
VCEGAQQHGCETDESWVCFVLLWRRWDEVEGGGVDLDAGAVVFDES